MEEGHDVLDAGLQWKSCVSCGSSRKQLRAPQSLELTSPNSFPKKDILLNVGNILYCEVVGSNGDGEVVEVLLELWDDVEWNSLRRGLLGDLFANLKSKAHVTRRPCPLYAISGWIQYTKLV